MSAWNQEVHPSLVLLTPTARIKSLDIAVLAKKDILETDMSVKPSIIVLNQYLNLVYVLRMLIVHPCFLEFPVNAILVMKGMAFSVPILMNAPQTPMKATEDVPRTLDAETQKEASNVSVFKALPEMASAVRILTSVPILRTILDSSGSLVLIRLLV